MNKNDDGISSKQRRCRKCRIKWGTFAAAAATTSNRNNNNNDDDHNSNDDHDIDYLSSSVLPGNTHTHTHTHTHTNEYTVASHRPEKGTSCKARHIDAPDTLESAMLSTLHRSGQVNKIASASTSVSNTRNNSVDSVSPQAFLP